MARKKHKLSLDPQYEFELFGLASHENDYRLAWAINKTLGTHLVKSDDLQLTRKGQLQSFSRMTFLSEDEVFYELISNASENGYLVTNLKNIDFFLKVTGDLMIEQLDQMRQKLKEAQGIIAVFSVDLSNIKNPEVFTIE